MKTKYSENCPDCGTVVGKPHYHGCLLDICSECGGEFADCNCMISKRAPLMWSGIVEDVRACQEFGFYARENPTSNCWEPCTEADEGSTEDYEEMRKHCKWDWATKKLTNNQKEIK